MAKYIDVEKVEGNAVFPYFGGDEGKRKAYRMGFYRAMQCVEMAEAEDVAPVIHGKKISPSNPADGFICSKCRFEMAEYLEIAYDCYIEFEPNFCPHCGAKIQKGGEKDEN